MNEYYEAFEELADEGTFRGQQWFGKRRDLVGKYGWAIPTDEAINYVAAFDYIVEIGAGNAYWAYLLEKADCSVECFDIENSENEWHRVQYGHAEQLSAQIRDNPVLMIWPPANSSMAWEVLVNEPSHVVYVGEPAGGCTGDDKFFEYLHKHYGLVAKIEIPSYAGVSDDLFHYTRKR